MCNCSDSWEKAWAVSSPSKLSLCCLSSPRIGRNSDLPCQSPSPRPGAGRIHWAQGLGALPSTLSSVSSSGQGLTWRMAVGEGFPFLFSPGKGIGSGDVFIPVTILAICTFLAGEVAGEVKQEKKKKPNRNGGCGGTSVGCVSFCLFFRVWKRHRGTWVLLPSPHSTQTLLLAGCSRNLLQKFPILCRMRMKGWLSLVFSLCQRILSVLEGWGEPSVLNIFLVCPCVWMEALS